MKKWWFSVCCWIVAVGFTIYAVVTMFVDEEIFFYTTQLISVLGPVLLLITIGMACAPKKGE